MHTLSQAAFFYSKQQQQQKVLPILPCMSLAFKSNVLLIFDYVETPILVLEFLFIYKMKMSDILVLWISESTDHPIL